MEGRGKPERGRREGVSERVREGKHKGLLSVKRLPFNSPQGRHAPHFTPVRLQAALNSDPVALVFLKCNTFCCHSFNKWKLFLLIRTFSHHWWDSSGAQSEVSHREKGQNQTGGHVGYCY